jgi:hypothetical protein
MQLARVLATTLIAFAACRDATGKQEQPPPQPAKTVTEPPAAVQAGSAAGSGSANDDYVPAEFKSGLAKWKDTVVYLDGRPIAYMQWGELPISLQPTWVKSKVSANKSASCPECPAWKWGEERYYRFTDYLKALGVDIKKIKALHVQGPQITNTIVVTSKDLMSPEGKDFLFRFGGIVTGKAIPHVPSEHFGNGLGPDKITSVMIYVDKKPPKLGEDGYMLDGVPIDGVPYYGEPLRGGIRVYLDDKLAAIVKRQDLDVKVARTNPDKELAWNLYEFLKKNGVDTSKVVEGWVIHDDRRREQIPASELSTMWFEAAAKSGKGESGAIALGDKKILANALALHTRAIKPEELPKVLPDEEP